MHIKRSGLEVMTFVLVAVTTISMFLLSTEASFSQSGQASAQLTAANQSAISTGGDPFDNWFDNATFLVGDQMLPGMSDVTKEATITNNGNLNLRYQLTTQSLEKTSFKLNGQIHMQLYVNNVLEYSGTFAGASTPMRTLAAGDSISVKAIFSWPYSPIDNTFSRLWMSDQNSFSDNITFSSQLENGDKGFVMMTGSISVQGSASAWITYVDLDPSQSVTRNSAPTRFTCDPAYSKLTLQYSTSSNFANPKSVTINYPEMCIISYTSPLTGLNPNTTYYVRVRGNNPPAPISNLPVDKMWSPTITFKTLP